MPLITSDELRGLQDAVASQQTVVASAIARLHLASPDPKALRRNDPNSILRTFKNLTDESWTHTNVLGALVFVIDRSTDSFLFQIWDLQSYTLRFEYELYYDIEYSMLSGQFHAFELEDAVAGFCFADPGEARTFLSKVMALRPTTKANAGQNLFKDEKKKGFLGMFGGTTRRKKVNSFDDGDLKIGNVRVVQHQQHVGVNADGTFDLNNLPYQWKQLFKEAGVKKKDLQDPKIASALMQTIQHQEAANEIADHYRNEYAENEIEVDDDAIDEAVGEFSPEELEAYQKYQRDLEKYYEELEAYEAEQEALAAWERDNAERVRKEKEAEERRKRKERKKGGPPPLPPRRLQEAAVKVEKEGKIAAKAVKAAETQYSEIKKDKAVDKAAKIEAKKAVQEAKAIAEEKTKEREKIQAELEAIKAKGRKNGSSALKRISLSLGRGRNSPSSSPEQVEEDIDIPPPPPPLPDTPQPPKLPELPKLGPDLSGIGNVKLKKTSAVNDRSKPQVKPKDSTLARAIKKGVDLKKPTPPRKDRLSNKGPLPDLKEMKPNQQNILMQKLIETMNERRGALGDDDDSDGDWSD